MFSQEQQQNICVISIINITKAFVTLKIHCIVQNKTNYSYKRLEIQEGEDTSPVTNTACYTQIVQPAYGYMS